MTSYLPRSHLARPFEMDTPPRAISHPRLQDAPPFRPSDTVMSGTPSNRHHALSFTHSAQPTHLRGETARPQGYGFPGTVGDERASVALNPHPADNYHDPQEIRDGNWSDGGTGYEYKGHSKRGPETYSESMSVSASQLKESRRVIRMSVSESDLLAPEAAQRHNIRRNKYPETEGEEDEDEGDENEGYKFDEFEDEVEDDDELREHIRVRSAEGVQLSFRARGSEQRGIQDGQSHPQHQHHQSQPRQQNYAYNYDQGSKHSDAGYSPVSSRDAPPESGRPSHYPPHQSHAPAHAYHGSSMPHPHDYPSQQHQSRGQHVPQHPRSYSYPHHHPSSAPYHQHASAPHYQSLPTNLAMPTPGHPTSPRTASRRGPYLSRQRALLAGLEATSPSSRYQCQYCHKRFSRPSSLRIHTYSHTGERPFKCSEEGCGRQFSVQSNMRRHLRVHRLGRMRSEFPPQD
ncbi:hypothetical protein BGX28_003725 [Mortierella sp. GBA30]|nr:hypothetical protein BGX28_003725 [Mortierella sp. GBA30]